MLAFALRLGWVLVATRVPVFLESGDAYSYFFYGRQLANGGGYLNLDGSGRATAYYPIGYPAVLGAIFWFVGALPLPDSDFALAMAGTVANAVFGAASVALLWVVVERVAGRRAATAAATIYALWPNAIAYAATLQLETAFTFASLAVLAIVATTRADERWPSWRRLVVFSAALGLSSLIRPFSLPFLLIPVIQLVARRAPLRVLAVSAAALLLPLVVVLTPWTLRNARAMGAALPFSSNLGDTLCIDRFAGANGGFRFADEGCADPRAGEVERNRESTALALDFVRRDPGREALQIVRRSRLILGSDHDGLDVAERYGRALLLRGTAGTVARAVADVAWFALLAAAVVGALVALLVPSVRRAEVLIVGLPLVSLFGTAALLWGTPRFHAPFVPYLAAFAGIAVAHRRSR